jgi:hypothetical protein
MLVAQERKPWSIVAIAARRSGGKPRQFGMIAIDQRIGIEERPAECDAHAGVARGAGNRLGLVEQGGAVLCVVAMIDGGTPDPARRARARAAVS